MPQGVQDTVKFTITWAGATQAKLHFVIDNDVAVVTDDDNRAGPGKIEFTYPVAQAPSHRIEWSLWFPGNTLSKLTATASVNGGAPDDLDEKDQAKNKWASQGVTT